MTGIRTGLLLAFLAGVLLLSAGFGIPGDQAGLTATGGGLAGGSFGIYLGLVFTRPSF